MLVAAVVYAESFQHAVAGIGVFAAMCLSMWLGGKALGSQSARDAGRAAGSLLLLPFRLLLYAFALILGLLVGHAINGSERDGVEQ